MKRDQRKPHRRRIQRAVKGGLTRMIKASAQALEATPAEAAPPAGESANNNSGIQRLDPQQWQLPEALAEAGDTESHSLMPSRFVLSIIVLAVLLIATIAWFVSQMPAK